MTRTSPYGFTIFLGAFLLFAVQPVLGRTLLPLFGGGPAVWTVCMLFFQIGLLGGYTFAHILGRICNGRTAALYHIAVLILSLVFLPLAVRNLPREMAPEWAVLALLASSAGLPYLVLASTGPLVQTWFREQFSDRSPYRLYSLSNIASMLALAAYPFVLEPLLSLTQQRLLWSAGYAAYVACCAWCAWSHRSSAACAQQSAPLENWTSLLWWVALAAAGSIVLLAITNQMCQEVASIPFLWVLPLAIYLLTFILAFDSSRWYNRSLYARLLSVAVPAACAVSAVGLVLPIAVQIAVYSLTLFVCAMACHGELTLSRPDPSHLTYFYLAIAAGGALGGTVVALGAPALFTSYLEFPLGLTFCCLLILAEWVRGGTWNDANIPVHRRFAPATGLALAAIVPLFFLPGLDEPITTSSFRNFYGILRFRERSTVAGPQREMRHGRITHGYQFLEQAKRAWPTSYYGPASGIGLSMKKLPAAASVGVIGLGAGTLAAYGRPGDVIRFYEINPDVIRLSHNYFSFQRDSAAKIQVVEGDGRIRLSQEPESTAFDLIAVDAFSSDAIPTHLLTVECAATYRRHLKPEGTLAIHISNQSLDLGPVVLGLAEELGMQALRVDSQEDAAQGTSEASWMLLTARSADRPASNKPRLSIRWTDDHVSLWQILRWH